MGTETERRTVTTMKDDTISRQAVLKLLHALPPEEAMTKALLIQGVKQMDAAQPYTDEEIQKMQDIEQAQLEKAYQLGYEEGKREGRRDGTD